MGFKDAKVLNQNDDIIVEMTSSNQDKVERTSQAENTGQHLNLTEMDHQNQQVKSGASNISIGSRNSLDSFGSPITFVNPDDIPERLHCVKCKRLMCNPYVIRTCGHNICNQCALNLIDIGTKSGHCPGDGREECDVGSFSMSDVHKDHGLRRDIQALKIHCPYKEQGCNTEIQFGQLEKHVKECTVGKLTNVENGAFLGVVAQLQNQINIMQREMREMREERQQYLGTINGLEQMVSNTNEKNKMYEKQMAKLLSRNYEETESEQVNHITTEMNQLKVQAESHQNKLSVMEATITESLTAGPTGQVRNMFRKINEKVALHEVELSEHDVRIQCLENISCDGKLVWKIANLSEHIEKAKSGKTLSLYSQPFYTDARGYKMCGRVYLNGDGQGKGTHISFYFVLMKGTYDELVAWPFQHKITLGTVDVNSSGKKSVSESFMPNPKSSSFKKPVATMNIASGCPKFLSHEDLFSGPYVKDDTIYLTMEVEKTDN